MKLVDCFSMIFSYTGYILKENTDTINPEKISDNYNSLINKAKKEATDSGFDTNLFDEALFAVCAWVDEKIFTSSSYLKNIWIKYQLQRKYFNTTNAGEEFYTRLNNIDSNNIELRTVYAYAMLLGFCGKYFSREDSDRLEEINKNNLKKIINSDDLKYPDFIFPNAYNSYKINKKWSNKPGFVTILLFVLPPLAFVILYLIYNSMLSNIFKSFL